MNNAYKKAIDVLTNKSITEMTLAQVAVQIAKDHPQTFINAYEKIRGPIPAPLTEPLWLTRVKSIAITNKIAAIKETRGVTGCGLKEAKDFVEANFTSTHPEIVKHLQLSR